MAMEAEKLNVLILCLFIVAITIPAVRGNIGDFDEHWKQRAREAKHAANEAYNPNPEEVTHKLNKEVHQTLHDFRNNSRRNLREKYKGPCLATNPIDSCWRCDPHWEQNRKKLADCALGFGHMATGGKAGPIYVVTDNSDNDMVNPKPGTLRHAVIQTGPLWIIFGRNMKIRLSQELMVTSDKTIDARGANVHIMDGAQITLQFVKNVIITNLHIHNNKPANGGMVRDSLDHFGHRTQSDGDGISLYGATNVWIDHVSLSNCADGLIDAIQGSTAITISNCHLTNHNDVMLFGSSDSNSADKVMQITLAFNHFGQGLVQRMPRCRWGFFHVVNNDYTHWLMYAIGGSANPTILSQGNRFIAPLNKASKEVTKRDNAANPVWKSWSWRSENDLMMNGAFFVESGGPITVPKENMIEAKPGTFVSQLTRFAGPLKCIKNKPC